MKLHNLLVFIFGLLFSVFSFPSLSQTPRYQNWYPMYCDTIQGANIKGAMAYLQKMKLKPRKTVVVGIIDSGIDTTVVDLQDALWTNKKEKPFDGKDNDHNGYVDDVHGWNFLGTADGKFNMTSAGTEEYRQFKRLYPKYKNVRAKDVNNLEEFRFYLKMKKKAGIDGYLRMYQFTKLKNKALHIADSILRKITNIDTLTIYGVMHIEVPDTMWQQVSQTFYVDLLKNDGATKWTAFLHEQDAKWALMQSRVYGIEHTKDKRLLMGDELTNANDILYGNHTLTVDGCYHGTFVAGVIAAQGKYGNPKICGVYPNAKLMIIRAAPDGDEYDKDVATAIRYAVDNGAKIINISLGKYTSPTPQMVNKAIAYAAKKNVMVVQAAGNNHLNIDSVAYYPTGRDNNGKFYSNFIRIGASTRKGNVASMSNYGKNTVHLFAPGEKITSVVPGNKYATEDGTSIAAPIVSGVAALIRSYFPKLTASEVVSILMRSVRTMKECNMSISGGMLDALRAVKLAQKIRK